MQWRIKLHRQIQDNPLRLQETFSRWQARVDILLLANHDSGSFRIRGNIVNVKRGQFAYAETTIAMRWKRSRNKLRNFFAELEESKMLVQHKNRLISIYTIVNYELYQTTDWTTESTTEGQQKNINKNDKNKQEWKNDDFEKLWILYPHARKWKKKEAQKKYEESAVPNDVWLKEITLYKWLVASGVQDAKYVPAAERYFRDFTPMNEIVYKQTLFRFFDWMKDQRGTDIGEKVREDFGRDYLEEMHKIYLSERKSPLMQSILSLTQ